MTYSLNIKNRARKMREEGSSIIEIARALQIAKSTTSLWVRDIPLSEEIALLIQKKEMNGREKAFQVMQAKRNFAKLQFEKEAESILQNINPLNQKNIAQLLCAIIFWCEGSKCKLGFVNFTNSDPALITLFISTLKMSFPIDASKFRALLHLHEYHDVKKQISFWSDITKIPVTQFSKSYMKPNTGIRKREDYPGCISIRYYDARIARKLSAMYHALAKSVVLEGA